MKRLSQATYSVLSAALIVIAFTGCEIGTSQSTHPRHDRQIHPVAFYNVTLEDNFWGPRLATQEEVLVPFAFKKVRPAIDALQMTGSFLAGQDTPLPKPHRYQSSDLYKIMEGAAYILQQRPHNAALEQRMDSIIDIIAAAQQPDGYLYVPHITGAAKDHAFWGGGGMGDRPYSWVIHSHELYNMGHMYEAAVAYFQATGKDKWLNVAIRNARHIHEVFFEGSASYNDGLPIKQAPGHQEIEIGLIKLFKVTHDSLYLRMAQKFLEIRGVTYQPKGEQYMSPTYSQQHLPVAEQREAVGHAVRAAYMYAAMADVSNLAGTNIYEDALAAIWADIVNRKMSITGGLGAVRGIEGFGEPYELPLREAHNETCAAVGNVFLNHRLFLMTGQAKYMDVAEVALYNNVLAGVNLAGDRFFYVNPLEADGKYPFNHGATGRSPWFNTACCPSNLARLLPQVPEMMYAFDDTSIYVNLYASSHTIVDFKRQQVELRQETNYPFDGTIRMMVNPSEKENFQLRLRWPSWATGTQFVPGDLYQYLTPRQEKPEVTINGKPQAARVENGFMVLERAWRRGDEVEVHLPMPIRFSRAHEKVAEVRDKVAVSRGPLVYCGESVDNPNDALTATIDPTASEKDLAHLENGPLQHIPLVTITENEQNLRLVPYYSWNNRGDGAMAVWFSLSD